MSYCLRCGCVYKLISGSKLGGAGKGRAVAPKWTEAPKAGSRQDNTKQKNP